VIDATGDADIAFRAGAPTRKTPKEEMMATSVMFSMSGVDKRRFLDAVKADPQTYKDWEGNGEWTIETSGKEDALFSPFIRKPFKQDGVRPAERDHRMDDDDHDRCRRQALRDRTGSARQKDDQMQEDRKPDPGGELDHCARRPMRGTGVSHSSRRD
jgi:hypothetical protein